MSDQEGPPKENCLKVAITLKREMFPDGAKFWDDDGTPKVTTPDGKVLAAGPDKFTEATARYTPTHTGRLCAKWVGKNLWKLFARSICELR